ncbi:MAG: RNA polymerase sigma factor (TIGR02999 family) [Planctomycetota bacterium]
MFKEIESTETQMGSRLRIAGKRGLAGMWNDVAMGLGGDDGRGRAGDAESRDSGEIEPVEGLDGSPESAGRSEDVGVDLFNLAYAELYRLAQSLMSGQAPQHTLQATALVNEAWVRLSRTDGHRWEGRGHFVATASRAMRSVLVDHARKKGNLKRSAPGERVPLDDVKDYFESKHVDILELDSALVRLAKMDASLVQLVELRYFAGLTIADTAKALGVTVRVVQQEWDTARTWLYKELK